MNPYDEVAILPPDVRSATFIRVGANGDLTGVVLVLHGDDGKPFAVAPFTPEVAEQVARNIREVLDDIRGHKARRQ